MAQNGFVLRITFKNLSMVLILYPTEPEAHCIKAPAPPK
jgi:hypothetical protein